MFAILAGGETQLCAQPSAGWEAEATAPTKGQGSSVFFASGESAGRDAYLGWGYKLAPLGRLDRPGLRFMAMTGVKLREVDPVLRFRYSRIHNTRALAGHEWRIGSLSIAAFAGVGYAFHTIDAALASGRRGRVGGVGMVELWYDWGQSTPLASKTSAATLLVDQATRNLYARMRHGFALPGGFEGSFGPELALSLGGAIRIKGIKTQDDWQRLRLGAHLSELALWRLHFGIAAGIELRRRANPVGYAALSSYYRY